MPGFDDLVRCHHGNSIWWEVCAFAVTRNLLIRASAIRVESRCAHNLITILPCISADSSNVLPVYTYVSVHH